MKYKKFDYKNYKDCYFIVSNYRNGFQPIAITIENKKVGIITTATVNMPGYCYSYEDATIKNYSENAGMTKFLKRLGIIKEIYSRRKAHPEASKSETIDFCEINIEKLKEYSKEFSCKWQF